MAYLSGNIAYAGPSAADALRYTFGVRTTAIPTTTRPVAPSPIPTVPRISATPISVTTTKLPVLLPKQPPVTVNTFGVPSQPSAPPPQTNTLVTGGASVSPSGEVAPEVGTMSAGMFGLSDVNPTALIFIGMAALVMFMESGKGGKRKKGR